MMLTTPAASQKQAFPLAGTLNRLSLRELHTKHRNSPSSPVGRKLLIKLNCAETEKLANSLILAQSCRAGSGVIRLLEIEESTFAIGGSWANSLILWRNAQSVCWKTKGEQYSGSPEHDCYSGSVVIRNGCNNENQQVITCSQLSPLVGVKLNQQITGKEKGSAENTTLEMVPLLIHEENQRSPVLGCKINHDPSNLSYEVNQQPPTLDDGDNQHIRTCETFLGHRVTVSKPVQPFGSMPRDCSSFLSIRLIQVASDESPSFFISASSCIRSSRWSRIWYWSVFALSLDIVITKPILSVGGCNYNVTEMVLQLLNTAKPRSARTLSGPLTTNVNWSNDHG